MEKRALVAEARVESQKLDIEYLKMEVAMLQNKKYSVSSDSITKENYPNLFNYESFNEIEANVDESVPDPMNIESGEIDVSFKAKGKKKQNLINRISNIEEKEIIHDLPSEEKTCSSCGNNLTRIGQTESYKIKIIPAKLIKEKHIYYTYKCDTCSRMNDKALISKAPYNLAFPKSMADSSLVSYIITEKFTKFVPLYRLEHTFLNFGIEISRANMSNWAMAAAAYLKPLFDIMHQDLMDKDIVLMDETTIQVIKNDRTKSYIWMMNSSKYDIPIELYFYKESREHHHAKDLLKGFKGHYVQSDCYEAYDKIPGVIDCACQAHAKRKYSDILKISNGKYSLTDSTCNTALSFFNRLNKIEKKLRNDNATIDEIFKSRQELSIPIIDEYKEWLENTYSLFPEKSKMAQAMFYSINNLDKLSNYCLDGRLEITNNKSERQAKSYVMLRKNMLFCFSEVGAEASATILSMVETARANDLRVFEYLKYVFDQLAIIDGTDINAIRRLLPYSPDLPQSLKIK